MWSDQEQLERLITRHLDGQLTADEELAFQRALLRDPAARALMDEYRELDEAAATALANVLPADAGSDLPFDPVELAQQHRPTARHRHHYRRAWWLVPGALAACLAGLVLLYPPDAALDQQPAQPVPAWQVAENVAPVEATPGLTQLPSDYRNTDPGVRQASTAGAPRRVLRDTDREWIGIEGDDGNLYWIEVDRTRTLRGQRVDHGVRQLGGGI